MTGGEVIAEALAAQGVRAVFGMPGTRTLEIYDGLRRCRDRIAHYLVRHEGGAALMADGYARAALDVGVCATVPGPGVTNASTGLLEAYDSAVPVLLVTGERPSREASRDASKVFHGLDQRAFCPSITKWTGAGTNDAEIPFVIRTAFEALRNGRPGPVQIDFPQDLMAAQLRSRPPSRVERRRPGADPGLVEETARALRSARRPLMLAGSDAMWSDAGEAILAVAEALDAPVATTFHARGIIPEDHPRSLGICRSTTFRRALQRTDALLAVGVRFTWRDTDNWALELPPTVVQIDSDPREIGREYPAACGLVGDPKTVLEQLLATSGGLRRGGAWGNDVLAELHAEAVPTERAPLLTALRKALDRDAVLSVDTHLTAYRTPYEFPIYEPGTYLFSAIAVTMGYGLPAALGAKVARPDRQVVCLSGDGGFMMTCQELATAALHNIPVVVIVVNDNCLTSIKRPQEAEFGGAYGTDLKNPDFIRFAESFGLRSYRADSSCIASTLREAFAADEPTLIEVPPEGV